MIDKDWKDNVFQFYEIEKNEQVKSLFKNCVIIFESFEGVDFYVV